MKKLLSNYNFVNFLNISKNYHRKYNIKSNIINLALVQSLPGRKQVIQPSEILERINIYTKAQALILDVGNNPPAILV